jgi:hypothetical protein
VGQLSLATSGASVLFEADLFDGVRATISRSFSDEADKSGYSNKKIITLNIESMKYSYKV